MSRISREQVQKVAEGAVARLSGASQLLHAHVITQEEYVDVIDSIREGAGLPPLDQEHRAVVLTMVTNNRLGIFS